MSRSLLALVLVPVLTASAAADLDHLQCFKLKPEGRLRATVDLTPPPELASATRCRITGPTLFCTPVTKTVVRADPPPAGAPAGPPATDVLCYRARCRGEARNLQVADQFATYSLRVRRSFLMCTPARRADASTTTTTTATTTSITTTQPVCGAAGEETCSGECPPGQACLMLSFGPAGSGCGCAPLPTCARDSMSQECGGNCPPACFCLSIGVDAPCVCVCI